MIPNHFKALRQFADILNQATRQQEAEGNLWTVRDDSSVPVMQPILPESNKTKTTNLLLNPQQKIMPLYKMALQ